MDPTTRANLERILAEQAELAGATGDLGTLRRLEPPNMAERVRPNTNFWGAWGDRPLSEAPFANAYRYGVTPPSEWRDLGGFDPDATFESVLREQGFEGWRNLLGQLVLGVAEPGPSDIARAFSLLVGIPLDLQKMIGKRIHPILRDADGTPFQQYHGTTKVYDRATASSPNFNAQLRGHHTTPDPTNASDFGGYGPGSNVRLESPVVRRVLETRSNVPMVAEEAVDLQRALEGYYRGKVPDDVLDETLRYIDDLHEGGQPFDIRHFDRIYDELSWNWKKAHDTSAPGPTRFQILRRGGWEGYSDLDEVYEFEFLTFDPKNLVRGNQPQDAVDWLLRQPDISPEEMGTITRIANEMGLELGGKP